MKKRGYGTDTFMIIGLIFVAALVIYTSGVIKKDCGRDKVCFKEHFMECKTAKLISIKNDNVYSYTIGSSFGSDCNMYVRMERIALGSDPQFEKMLEGREMTCSIPRQQIREVDVDNLNSFIDYCQGELKEGLYELIIQRMYTLVVKELGSIIEQARKAVLSQV
ncbi:MAG: hypothetical protein AABW87_00595 [Nanoarchaeota archaeon]